MKLIDADTVVTIQVYDDMTGKTDTKKMTIADAIDEWSDEGCPSTVDAVPTDFHDKCQQIEIQKRLKLEEELKNAVEVVRCKECKFYDPLDANRPYDCMYMDSIFGDDYCSRGEKLPEPMVYPQVEGITPTVVKMDEVTE